MLSLLYSSGSGSDSDSGSSSDSQSGSDSSSGSSSGPEQKYGSSKQHSKNPAKEDVDVNVDNSDSHEGSDNAGKRSRVDDIRKIVRVRVM